MSTSTCLWSSHHSENLFSSCLKTERPSASCSSVGVLCQNVGVPGSPDQETLVSRLQLYLMEEMAVTFLSPCLKATNPVQTQGKMCHQLSSPRTHRDLLAQGPELCPYQLCCDGRSQLHRWSPACAGSARAVGFQGLWGCRQAAGQAEHSPLCTRHSYLALGLWAQGAGSLVPCGQCWWGCCILPWEPLPPGCLPSLGRAEGTAHC